MHSSPNPEARVPSRDEGGAPLSAMNTILTSKHTGTPDAQPPVRETVPTVDAAYAARLARYAKALGEPIRLRLVDVLARHPGELCAGELLPLFGVAKSTLSHHLKTLAEAGIIEARHRGTFAYYLVDPQALADLAGWLRQTTEEGTQRAGAEHPPQAAASSVTFPELITDKRGERSV